MQIPGISAAKEMRHWVMGKRDSDPATQLLYDRTLLWFILFLIVVGQVMVTSASMSVADRLYNDPFFFAKREAIYFGIGLLAALVTLRISMDFWQRLSPVFLLVTLFLLVVVLVAGDSVNGASRWIGVGPIRIQPAELSKLALFCYLASYLVRKVEEVRSNFWGFIKPMGVMLFLAVLLLAQPDLGTVVVLFVTTLGMLFLAGARLWQFIAIICMGGLAVALLIVTEPYRMRRMTSFLNPWENPFGNGYQLVQSLMAIGRGEVWGQGLGNSIQKQEYLPEAHTDFIFAIIAEELGFIGVVLLLLVLFFLAFRAMSIGKRALEAGQRFAGFLACGIGVWISFQILINIGAAAGMLPTKGLTLPLISYGGSSLVVMCVALAMLLRIDFETRLAKAQAHIRVNKN